MSLKSRGLRSAAELASNRLHGDRLRYMAGCRCAECRRANCEYEKQRYRARKAGDWNGLVDAAPARAHLLALSRAGVGRRTVADVSGVAQTVICDVRAGTKLRIRARTARAVLAVTQACAADGAIVRATEAQRLLRQLKDEGFSKRELARRLGSQAKSPALQVGSRRIRLRTLAKVRRVYSEVMV